MNFVKHEQPWCTVKADKSFPTRKTWYHLPYPSTKVIVYTSFLPNITINYVNLPNEEDVNSNFEPLGEIQFNIIVIQ